MGSCPSLVSARVHFRAVIIRESLAAIWGYRYRSCVSSPAWSGRRWRITAGKRNPSMRTRYHRNPAAGGKAAMDPQRGPSSGMPWICLRRPLVTPNSRRIGSEFRIGRQRWRDEAWGDVELARMLRRKNISKDGEKVLMMAAVRKRARISRVAALARVAS